MPRINHRLSRKKRIEKKPSKAKIIFLIGSTAIGKTEIAACLAKKIKAEIISCDSMQVYKTMDIITSKPSRRLQKIVPHHLINIVSPEKPYDVWRYRRDAVAKIKEILHRAKTPLFVGGTGLYMSIVIDGIFKTGSQNQALRAKLYQEAEDFGSQHLYERLKTQDPEAAAKIHPNDTKRIIRALEVFQITGQPISELQKQRKGLSGKYDIRIFGLNMERDKLYQRIDERLEKMFRKGLVKEVKKLLKLKLSRTASYAIGIKELKGYFDAEYDLEEAKRLIKRNTRLYVKRQLTWFRKDKRIQWIGVTGEDTPSKIANTIINQDRVL